MSGKRDHLHALKDRYLQRLEIRNFSRATIKLRRSYLNRFLAWCAELGLTQLKEITRDVLLSYQRHLYHHRSERTGKPLQVSTQASLLTPVRAWFRFLVREGVAASNPALDLDVPRQPQRLPGQVLSTAEAERIVSQPDTATPLGLRDRAMLETLYSTAMRRGELLSLSVYDLDFERQMVMIRQGKGGKDRNVPIGARAAAWLAKYLTTSRPALAEQTGTNTVFLSRNGKPLGGPNLSLLIRSYVERAGVTRPGSCHLFRHAAATQMLENGADLSSLQALLGHAKVTTTQIYTHISITRLKQVHSDTHPTSRKEKPEEDPPAAC